MCPLQLSCVQSRNLEHPPKRLLLLSAWPGGAATVSSRPDCCCCDKPHISAGCEMANSLQAVGAAEHEFQVAACSLSYQLTHANISRNPRSCPLTVCMTAR